MIEFAEKMKSKLIGFFITNSNKVNKNFCTYNSKGNIIKQISIASDNKDYVIDYYLI